MKAHVRTGFQTIHTFQDKIDNWNILLWDWNRTTDTYNKTRQYEIRSIFSKP
jgi:hypothetical protein